MAAISTLVDNFDSATLDTAKWTLTEGTVGMFQLVNKRIEITVPTLTNTTGRIDSVDSYDLTGSSAYVRMTGLRDGATGGETIFMLRDSTAANQVRWGVNNGSAVAQERVAGAAVANLANLVYYPEEHAWFRIRETSGTTYWETAPSTASNPPIESDWVVRHSKANPIAVTALFVRLSSGSFNATSADPGTATFDGLNTSRSEVSSYAQVGYVGISTLTSTEVWGTTSATPQYPAGLAAGDKMYLCVTAKYSGAITVPAGWTLIANTFGGPGGTGVDTGNVYTYLYEAEAAGGETGTITVSKANETGSLIGASILGFHKKSGSAWQTASTSVGSDATNSTDYVFTGGSSFNVQEGDLLFVTNGLNSDAATGDAHTLTLSNTLTQSSVVEIRDTGTANGHDGRSVISLHYVTHGTNQTVTPSYSMTLGGSYAGSSIITRLRTTEVTTTSGTASPTQTADTGSASGAINNRGTASPTQANQTSTASGTINNRGTASPTQASNTASASGTLTVTGTASNTQASDTASASGTVPENATGTASPTQAADTASASGSIVENATGTAAPTQSGNTSTASGTVTNRGTAAPTQSANTASASGSAQLEGIASPTQAGNTSSGSGAINNRGTAAITAGSDTSTAEGIVYQPITGTAAITQAGDTSSASGLHGMEIAQGVHPGMYLRQYHDVKVRRLKRLYATTPRKITPLTGHAQEIVRLSCKNAKSRVIRIVAQVEQPVKLKGVRAKAKAGAVRVQGMTYIRASSARSVVRVVDATGEALAQTTCSKGTARVGAVRVRSIHNPSDEQLIAMYRAAVSRFVQPNY